MVSSLKMLYFCISYAMGHDDVRSNSLYNGSCRRSYHFSLLLYVGRMVELLH